MSPDEFQFPPTPSPQAPPPKEENPARPRTNVPPMPAVFTQEMSITVGPLPPPAVLREYNEIIPGAAERFLGMVETQSRHRQEIEKSVVATNSRDSLLGIITGGGVAFAVLLLAAYAVKMNHPHVASFFAAADLGSLVGVFIYGTKAKRKQLQGRSQASGQIPRPS